MIVFSITLGHSTSGTTSESGGNEVTSVSEVRGVNGDGTFTVIFLNTYCILSIPLNCISN